MKIPENMTVADLVELIEEKKSELDRTVEQANWTEGSVALLQVKVIDDLLLEIAKWNK